jgi:predicted membrane protein
LYSPSSSSSSSFSSSSSSASIFSLEDSSQFLMKRFVPFLLRALAVAVMIIFFFCHTHAKYSEDREKDTTATGKRNPVSQAKLTFLSAPSPILSFSPLFSSH